MLSFTIVDYDKYFEITKNIELFANVYKEINANYVDETNPSKLMKVGIDAMLNSLDPFTNYISEAQIENYRLMVEGKYNGIGARAKKIGDYVVITEVYENFPAHKAGLRAGDQVLTVNKQDAKGKDSEDLNQIMRGTPKSEVEVSVKRPGQSGILDFKIVRDEVNIPNVPFSGMVDSTTGYLCLTTFTENAGKNVADAVRNLKKDHPSMSSLIFDLRDNGGGLLHEAVNVCNAFIPQGTLIASTRSKLKEKDLTYSTRGASVDENIPIVVLINKHSASASEIVSGALQDLDRAVIMGQISYGKGLVQNTKSVGYNAQVKLTIAKYYIPSGRCIQSVNYVNGQAVHLPDSLRTKFKTRNGRPVYDGGGVKPDVEIPEANYPEIVQKLIDNNYIFNFCTDYLQKIPTPKSTQEVQFDDFEQFVAYLKTQNFDDRSDLEVKLDELKKQSENTRDVNIKEDLTNVQNKLERAQWQQINSNKELIINLIKEDLSSRLFFEKGKYEIKLKQDPLIKDAVELLKQPDKMARVLKP